MRGCPRRIRTCVREVKIYALNYRRLLGAKSRKSRRRLFARICAQNPRFSSLGIRRLCVRKFESHLVVCEDHRIQGDGWLGREDSNLRMAESKSAALPLGDAPTALALGPRAADHNRRPGAPQRFSARQNRPRGEARGGRKARAPAPIAVTALPTKAVARMRQAEQLFEKKASSQIPTPVEHNAPSQRAAPRASLHFGLAPQAARRYRTPTRQPPGASRAGQIGV